MSSWPHTFATQYPSVALSWLDDQFNQLSATSTSTVSLAGTNLIGYSWTGAPTSKTVSNRLTKNLYVTDNPFNAVGDGVTDDTPAVTAAAAIGIPVYVPYTTAFYSLTALSNANLALLYGPGRVKVNGTVQQISSEPGIAWTDQAVVTAIRSALAPANNSGGTAGSVGCGAINSIVTRSGGFGQYGNWLNQYLVTAATSSPQFDVATSGWASHTNLTGGNLFGSWFGANTPSAAPGTETYSSGAIIGSEINAGNRWFDFGYQSDVGGTRYVVGLQVIPDTVPSLDTQSYPVTNITIASPGVATITAGSVSIATAFPNNTPVILGGSGTIPTGLVAGTVYYVVNQSGSTIQFASSIGGTAINTTGSFVAPVNITPYPPGNFGIVLGPSNNFAKWWVGTLTRFNTLMPAGYAWLLNGGSSSTINNPNAMILGGGFWVDGMDFSATNFSGTVFNFSSSNQTSSTATAGAIASPGNYAGFLKFAVDGTTVKIPYFNN